MIAAKRQPFSLTVRPSAGMDIRVHHAYKWHMRLAALTAIVLGTLGSLGLFLRAGQRTPRFLLVLMGVWVFTPFVALAWANVVSKRWPSLTRATLHGVTIAVSLGTLAIYADDAMGHRTAKAAFVFVAVPPASCVLAVVAVAIAALVSRRR